jgi:hypothetical protein
MKKLKLPFAAFLLLSLPLRAQLVAGSASEAAAWVGPMTGAVSGAGSDRVAGLGFTSLTALSRLDQSGHYPFVSAPHVLAPLVPFVQAQGFTPKAFAALPTTEKLAVLSRAAAPAEAQAAQLADEAVTAVSKPIGLKTYDDVARKVNKAGEFSFYLPAERAAAVAAAAEVVAEYSQKRAELRAAWVFELPAKIAAGAFDGKNLLGRDQDGWYAADENPNRRYATLQELYDARIQRASQAPQGPWTVAEYNLMHEALGYISVAPLDDPWTAGRASWNESELPSSRLKNKIADLRGEALKWSAQNPELHAAVLRLAAGTPRAKDLKAVDRFYWSPLKDATFARDFFVGDGTGSNWTSQARIIAEIRTGGTAMPSWARIQELRSKLIRRYNQSALAGLIGFTASFFASLAGAAHSPRALGFASATAMIAMLASLAWVCVNRYRRDEPNFDARSIDTRLREY